MKTAVFPHIYYSAITHTHTHTVCHGGAHAHRANSIPRHCSKRPSSTSTHTHTHAIENQSWPESTAPLMLHTGNNGYNGHTLFGYTEDKSCCWANYLSDWRFSVCWDRRWRPGTLCLMSQASVNTHHVSTPTEQRCVQVLSRHVSSHRWLLGSWTGLLQSIQAVLALTPILISQGRLKASTHRSFKSNPAACSLLFLPLTPRKQNEEKSRPSASQ